MFAIFSLLFATTRVVPQSCDFIIIVHNEKCLGKSSYEELGECMKKYLSKSSTKHCYSEYTSYLEELNNNIDDTLTAKQDGQQISFLANSPVLTPVEIEKKIAGLNSECRISKRGFSDGAKQAWSNIAELLHFSIRFLHWVIYLSLGLIYAVPALILSSIITLPFIVSKNYFERFGCLLGNMMEFFVRYTRYIAPWNKKN